MLERNWKTLQTKNVEQDDDNKVFTCTAITATQNFDRRPPPQSKTPIELPRIHKSDRMSQGMSLTYVHTYKTCDASTHNGPAVKYVRFECDCFRPKHAHTAFLWRFVPVVALLLVDGYNRRCGAVVQFRRSCIHTLKSVKLNASNKTQDANICIVPFTHVLCINLWECRRKVCWVYWNARAASDYSCIHIL